MASSSSPAAPPAAAAAAAAAAPPSPAALRLLRLHSRADYVALQARRLRHDLAARKDALRSRRLFLDLRRRSLQLAKDRLRNEQEWLVASQDQLEGNKVALYQLLNSVYQQQWILVSALADLYPIRKEKTDTSHFASSIRAISLPDSDFAVAHDMEDIATALGFCAHLVLVLADILAIPLRYPICACCSRSFIMDCLSDPDPMPISLPSTPPPPSTESMPSPRIGASSSSSATQRRRGSTHSTASSIKSVHSDSHLLLLHPARPENTPAINLSALPYQLVFPHYAKHKHAGPIYPLFERGSDRFRFEYAVYLLNKNIEVIANARGINLVDLRCTLTNLKLCMNSIIDFGIESADPSDHLDDRFHPSHPATAHSDDSTSDLLRFAPDTTGTSTQPSPYITSDNISSSASTLFPPLSLPSSAVSTQHPRTPINLHHTSPHSILALISPTQSRFPSTTSTPSLGPTAPVPAHVPSTADLSDSDSDSLHLLSASLPSLVLSGAPASASSSSLSHRPAPASHRSPSSVAAAGMTSGTASASRATLPRSFAGATPSVRTGKKSSKSGDWIVINGRLKSIGAMEKRPGLPMPLPPPLPTPAQGSGTAAGDGAVVE